MLCIPFVQASQPAEWSPQLWIYVNKLDLPHNGLELSIWADHRRPWVSREALLPSLFVCLASWSGADARLGLPWIRVHRAKSALFPLPCAWLPLLAFSSLGGSRGI